MCIFCVISSVLGGAVGSRVLGLNTVKTKKGGIATVSLTAISVVITNIALKYLINFSICGGKTGLELLWSSRIIIVIGETVLLGTLYGAIYNHVIHYLFESSRQMFSCNCSPV